MLSKIKYDSRLNPDDFYIIFRDTSKYKKIRYSEIKLTKGGFYYNENFIPYHRVIEIASDKGVILLKREFKLKPKDF